MKKAELVMHPLPRGPELPEELWSCRKDQILEHVHTAAEVREQLIDSCMSGDMFAENWPSSMLASSSTLRCRMETCAGAVFLPSGPWEVIDINGSLVCSWCLTPMDQRERPFSGE